MGCVARDAVGGLGCAIGLCGGAVGLGCGVGVKGPGHGYAGVDAPGHGKDCYDGAEDGEKMCAVGAEAVFHVMWVRVGGECVCVRRRGCDVRAWVRVQVCVDCVLGYPKPCRKAKVVKKMCAAGAPRAFFGRVLQYNAGRNKNYRAFCFARRAPWCNFA